MQSIAVPPELPVLADVEIKKLRHVLRVTSGDDDGEAGTAEDRLDRELGMLVGEARPLGRELLAC